jgi:nucleotidyltransferase substrate binding protein (TIGR01987 family)
MNIKERTRLQIETFSKALARLEEVMPMDESEVVRDAMIQRFEFTFELGWKAMRHVLLDWGERVPEVVGSVIQQAKSAHLIDDAAAWLEIRDCRNLTSHTYDEGTAVKVAATVRAVAVAEFRKLREKFQSIAA